MIGNKLEPFKFWCQKVLPNVYDDSLSYYEYLCKLNEYLNEVIAQINTLTDNMEDYEADLTATWLETKEYIDNYFNNLNVQQEINNKLDAMALSGELSTLLAPIVGTQIGGVVAEQIDGTVANQIDGVVANQIGDVVAEQIDAPTATAVTSWLNANVDPVGSAVVVDKTLSIDGAAADANVTGNNVHNLSTIIGYTDEQLINKSDLTDLTVYSVASGYWLKADGKGESQAGYSIKKFTLNRVNYVYLTVPDSNSPTIYRFCETTDTNDDVVGEIFVNGFDGIVNVPSGANYLFVACETSNANSVTAKGFKTNYRTDINNKNIDESDFNTFNSEQSKLSFNEVPIRNTESGYWLNENGFGETKTGYSFNKYETKSLKYLYVDIPSSNSPVIFRFSDTFAGNGTVVGDLFVIGYKGFVTVPTGAIALFVACDNTNLSNIKIYGCGQTNGDLNNTINVGTRFTIEVSADDSNANYWLNSSGGGESASGFTFDEYPVSEGETLFIDVPFCNSPTLYRFSDSRSGSSSSVVGSLYKTPFRGFITVPTGANHLFIARLSTDTRKMCYKLEFNNKVNKIARGFVFINKHNNKIYIKTTSNYYVLLDGVLTYVGRVETSIDDSSNNCLIIATKSSFKKTDVKYKPKNDEIIIASIVYGVTTTYIQNVIPDDSPLVKNWYQRTNIPTYFNNKKQKHYQMKKAPSNDIINCDYFMKITNRYSSANTSMYYLYNDIMCNDDYPIFVQNTSSIANKKILTIGDSFTKRGWYQQQIKERENTVTFVGTQATNHNNLMCEGYSGARSDEVFGSTLQGNPSPFYNPDTHGVDYSYYVRTQGIAADMIVIMFGLNENNVNNYFTAIQNFVNSVYDYDPTIPVYVVQPCIESNDGSTTQESYYYDNAQYNCGVAWIDFTNCVKIPMRNCMIDEFDYDKEQLDYGYNNEKINGTSDAVHPSEDVGFKKIGDQIYNWLGI